MRYVILTALAVAGCGSPSVATDARSVCARYVTCVAERNPQELVAIQQTYGNQGACWLSGVSADTCGQQCQDGLRQLLDPTGTYPDCNRCASNLDCVGGGAAYVCDTGAGKCVECLTNADCRSRTDRPICSPQHICAPCTQNGQCATGQVCSPLSGACCTPKTCEANMCGDTDDGCGGTLHCGTCARGTCVTNYCDTSGLPCTVGDGSCGRETCMFDGTSQAYVCASTLYEGMTCNGLPPLCSSTVNGQLYTTLGCYLDLCRRHCLKDGDCASGETCHADGPTISPSRPGYCM